MITALDTNVLLDLLIPNARFLDSSRSALEKAHSEGPLILCEAVWSELASQFESREEVATFLRDTGIRLVPATPEALFEASRSWKLYRERRKEGLICAACGHTQGEICCSRCSQPLRGRQHIISDFLIGAHAQVLADRLLTRDRGLYAAYFPKLLLFV